MVTENEETTQTDPTPAPDPGVETPTDTPAATPTPQEPAAPPEPPVQQAAPAPPPAQGAPTPEAVFQTAITRAAQKSEEARRQAEAAGDSVKKAEQRLSEMTNAYEPSSPEVLRAQREYNKAMDAVEENHRKWGGAYTEYERIRKASENFADRVQSNPDVMKHAAAYQYAVAKGLLDNVDDPELEQAVIESVEARLSGKKKDTAPVKQQRTVGPAAAGAGAGAGARREVPAAAKISEEKAETFKRRYPSLAKGMGLT